ncbi:serine acetyltransferase (plasmid) [Pantoea eucalypti]|uniref:Serine acetyltransferase n=1 Tax=Pantoea eucalypti TaxID=470933 RepID=A0ABY2ZAX5_9GAMM|nr:serine acetyltransferase [Pantoea eucalypti]QGF29578.1 serine acetyltransferase [Pantoea eucalypti]TPV30118.1 serine acetyltransferase [Pantoea eucalypti]
MKYAQLKRFWHVEVIGIEKKFSWFRLATRLRNKPGLKFIFWWRLASFLYENGYRRIAYRIHSRIKGRFACDIMLGAKIGEGLSIAHHVGVVVTKRVVAGRNMRLTQNSVIGNSGKGKDGSILIGDNFFLGSNSCVIADNLVIGNNVTVGAMSFINKDIPDNSTVYTRKTVELVERD